MSNLPAVKNQLPNKPVKPLSKLENQRPTIPSKPLKPLSVLGNPYPTKHSQPLSCQAINSLISLSSLSVNQNINTLFILFSL